MSSLSWLGKTLCPPDCLVKSDIKAPSCAAIFRLGIVVLQCVRTGEVFCGLHVAHVHIICPVRDVTHVRKCTRPSPAFPYCKRRKAGRGPGNEAINHTKSIFARYGIPETVISDNGPQFSSEAYAQFAREYGFKHATSSPNHPQGNGEAERGVQTIKNLLKKEGDPYLAFTAKTA